MSAASMASRDPYYAARDQLSANLAKTHAQFTRWKEILETQNTAASAEFAQLGKAVQLDLRVIGVDRGNLAQVVATIERNRAAFSHIDERELDERRKFVGDAAQRAQAMEDFMTSARSRRKMERDQRADLMQGGGMGVGSGAGAGTAVYGRSSDLVVQKRSLAAAREAEHDVVLDDMSAALDRLAGTGRQMQGSLQTQSALLDEMGSEMQQTEGLMATSIRKMDTLLAKSRGGRLACMGILIVIAVLLFFLIIYT